MAAPATAEAIRDVNTRYHDAAAEHYDTKWGVDYGDVGRSAGPRQAAQAARQAAADVRALAGDRRRHRLLHAEHAPGRRRRARRRRPTSRRACSTRCRPTPQRIGVRVRTVACDAEELPFADESFDLVLGHAVLHHLPHLDRAFAEFERVLRPGGRFVFAGEPSRTGDRIAAYPKGAGLRLAPLWRQVVGARPADGYDAPDGHGDVARRARRPRRRVARAVRRRARVHARRARRVGARRRLRRRRRARRGAARELVRLDEPHARGDRAGPRTSRGCGASTRFAATCCCSASTSRCSRGGCRRRSSTTS